MDFGYGDRVDGVFRFIENAEVMAVFFPKFGQSVVVDVREKNDEPPLVRVVPMAQSIAERLRTIKRMRPGLPRPEDIVAVPWVGYVDALKSSGLWGRVVARVEATGNAEAIDATGKVFEELLHIERLELAQVIIGEQYETLWPREVKES